MKGHNMNSVLVDGKVESGPDTYFIGDTPHCDFRIAVNHVARQAINEALFEETYVFEVSLTGKPAERSCDSLWKGRKCRVVGRLAQYESKGTLHVKINADHIDLSM